jgi:hypothetical protein
MYLHSQLSLVAWSRLLTYVNITVLLLCENGEFSGIKIGRGNGSTRRKPTPMPLCPPQNLLDLTRARTRAAAVGSQQLTAWAMARPFHFHISKYFFLCCEINTSVFPFNDFVSYFHWDSARNTCVTHFNSTPTQLKGHIFERTLLSFLNFQLFPVHLNIPY